jgi:uncharacterized protein (UPF0332 family)
VLDPDISQVIDRVEQYLNTASLALENRDPDSASSRAYYALYHMTVLLLRVVWGVERDRWDHPQLHKAFLDHFCKSGFRFSQDDGREWGDVMQARINADYWLEHLRHRTALRSVDKARRLVNKMKIEVGRYAN